jgi:type IV pilus assembly protein PilA
MTSESSETVLLRDPGRNDPPKKKSRAVWIAVIAGVGCMVVLVGVAVVGIIAAIAIPSLLRARISANEAVAIGDIRSVISAEEAYRYSNSNGYYGTLECLVAPEGCISGYTGPFFISKEVLPPEKSGYRRTFTLSPDNSHYTFIAVPLAPGQTGLRGFCGDNTGIVCSTSGSLPQTNAAGECDLSVCSPLG